MKKDKRTTKDELRAEYKRSDFTGPMIRGKYRDAWEASNIVVLKPDVASHFQTKMPLTRHCNLS